MHEGFRRDDLFVCVHEQFMTETAAMADIVLPATTFLEHDDIYTAGGHTFLQIGRAVLPPYAECRSNHDVICGLAKRLGARHPGFEMTAFEIDRARRCAPAACPGRRRSRRASGSIAGPASRRGISSTASATPTSDSISAPNWRGVRRRARALPAFPDHVAVLDDGDPERPFRLVPAPSRSFLNTSFNNIPAGVAREGRPTALVHPDALAALGIADGARIRLGNDKGSVVVHARAFDGLQPRVVVVEGLWPNHAFEEGIGINLLDQRRSRPARRRRRVPRHRRLAQAGLTLGARIWRHTAKSKNACERKPGGFRKPVGSPT